MNYRLTNPIELTPPRLLIRLILLFLLSSILVVPFVYSQNSDDEVLVPGTIEEPVDDQNSDADPVELFNKAQTHHESGEFDKALELYKKALEEMPEFPEAEYQIATIYLVQGKQKEAEEALRRALSYRRDWTLALITLGKVLIRAEKLDEASLILDKAIRIDPKASDAYVGLADVYTFKSLGKEKLKTLYSRLVFFSSGARATSDIWSARAAVELKLGMMDEASASISNSLRKSPGNLRARVLLVEFSMLTGDFEGAVTRANRLVSEFPSKATYTVMLAEAHIANSSPEKAGAALDSFPGNDPRITLIRSKLNTGSKANIEELKKLIASDPKNINALTSLCNDLRRGEPKNALDYCRRAYELEPSNVKHAIGFGAALVQLRKFDAAVKLLEDIKRRYPANYTARANLASAYFQMRAFEQAKVEYLWITQNAPDVHIAHYLLGICHDRLKEFAEAYGAYQTFLRIADKKKFADETDRVKLRLSVLKDFIKKDKGK